MHFAHSVIPSQSEPYDLDVQVFVTLYQTDLERAIRHLPRYEAIVLIGAVYNFSADQARRLHQTILTTDQNAILYSG